MNRSDMPKQVQAFRNGGGLMSLATVPMETSIYGQPHELAYIRPDEAELLKSLGGMGTPGPGGIPQYGKFSDFVSKVTNTIKNEAKDFAKDVAMGFSSKENREKNYSAAEIADYEKRTAESRERAKEMAKEMSKGDGGPSAAEKLSAMDLKNRLDAATDPYAGFTEVLPPGMTLQEFYEKNPEKYLDQIVEYKGGKAITQRDRMAERAAQYDIYDADPQKASLDAKREYMLKALDAQTKFQNGEISQREYIQAVRPDAQTLSNITGLSVADSKSHLRYMTDSRGRNELRDFSKILLSENPMEALYNANYALGATGVGDYRTQGAIMTSNIYDPEKGGMMSKSRYRPLAATDNLLLIRDKKDRVLLGVKNRETGQILDKFIDFDDPANAVRQLAYYGIDPSEVGQLVEPLREFEKDIFEFTPTYKSGYTKVGPGHYQLVDPYGNIRHNVQYSAGDRYIDERSQVVGVPFVKEGPGGTYSLLQAPFRGFLPEGPIAGENFDPRGNINYFQNIARQESLFDIGADPMQYLAPLEDYSVSGLYDFYGFHPGMRMTKEELAAREAAVRAKEERDAQAAYVAKFSSGQPGAYNPYVSTAPVAATGVTDLAQGVGSLPLTPMGTQSYQAYVPSEYEPVVPDAIQPAVLPPLV
jgi:hypothetical protein